MIQIGHWQKVVGQQTELDSESLAVAPGEVPALLNGVGSSEKDWSWSGLGARPRQVRARYGSSLPTTASTNGKPSRPARPG
jgi:hypothetical protein